MLLLDNLNEKILNVENISNPLEKSFLLNLEKLKVLKEEDFLKDTLIEYYTNNHLLEKYQSNPEKYIQEWKNFIKKAFQESFLTLLFYEQILFLYRDKLNPNVQEDLNKNKNQINFIEEKFEKILNNFEKNGIYTHEQLLKIFNLKDLKDKENQGILTSFEFYGFNKEVFDKIGQFNEEFKKSFNNYAFNGYIYLRSIFNDNNSNIKKIIEDINTFLYSVIIYKLPETLKLNYHTLSESIKNKKQEAINLFVGEGNNLLPKEKITLSSEDFKKIDFSKIFKENDFNNIVEKALSDFLNVVKKYRENNTLKEVGELNITNDNEEYIALYLKHYFEEQNVNITKEEFENNTSLISKVLKKHFIYVTSIEQLYDLFFHDENLIKDYFNNFIDKDYIKNKLIIKDDKIVGLTKPFLLSKQILKRILVTNLYYHDHNILINKFLDDKERFYHFSFQNICFLLLYKIFIEEDDQKVNQDLKELRDFTPFKEMAYDEDYSKESCDIHVKNLNTLLKLTFYYQYRYKNYLKLMNDI